MSSDINNLEGRALDEAVARQVFGWEDMTGCLEYSSSPAAMMEVIHKMHSLHHVVSIMWHTDNEVRCEIDDWCEVADTAPLAVCRAALAAVQKNQEVRP